MSLSVPLLRLKPRRDAFVSWTRYANLSTWFDNFKVFLIEFGFDIVGCDGEPVFDEKTMHQILNLDAWISLSTGVRQ
jgi:hypothetical protein